MPLALSCIDSHAFCLHTSTLCRDPRSPASIRILFPVPLQGSEWELPLVQGEGTYGDVSLQGPKVGTYRLQLSNPALGLTTVNVVVTEGRPTALVVAVQPSHYTDNAAPLRQQPAVELRDGGNNPVRDVALLRGLEVVAAVAPRPPGNRSADFAARLEDTAFAFRTVEFVAEYGVAYALVFHLVPAEGLTVEDVASRPIEVPPVLQPIVPPAPPPASPPLFYLPPVMP